MRPQDIKTIDDVIQWLGRIQWSDAVSGHRADAAIGVLHQTRFAGRTVHYAGALSWDHGKSRTTILGGWAACCSGDKADAIRKRGDHSYESSAVTCKRCLANMAKATASARARIAKP